MWRWYICRQKYYLNVLCVLKSLQGKPTWNATWESMIQKSRSSVHTAIIGTLSNKLFSINRAFVVLEVAQHYWAILFILIVIIYFMPPHSKPYSFCTVSDHHNKPTCCTKTGCVAQSWKSQLEVKYQKLVTMMCLDRISITASCVFLII